MNINKENSIHFNNKDILIPNKTLVLNMSPWSQDLINSKNIIDANIYKTFVKAVFGDYVEDDKIGEQHGNTIFSKVWFDGNVAYAQIRDKLSFRDGKIVTPNDIEFSITRFFVTGDKFDLTKAKNSMIPLTLSNIVGYNNAINSKNKEWHTGIISGIRKINENTISFILKAKDINFFRKLNMGFFPLVNEEQFDKELQFKDIPDGCGDFKIVKYDKKLDFYLLKNMQPISKKSPKFVAFIFSPDDVGDITSVYQAEKHKRNLNVFVSSNLYTAYGFTFNFKSILGADPRFRELFEITLDRKKIAESDKYKRFVPDNQLIPNFGDNYKYRIPYNEKNTDRAKKILGVLKKDYHEIFKNNNLIIPTLFVPYENPEEQDIFKELKREFSEIGFNIRIENEKYSDEFFNPISSSPEKRLPVLIFPKILVKESQISTFNSFIPSNTNLIKNDYFKNSDENDYTLIELYNQALIDNNKIREFNQYFCSKNIFVVFVSELKNFAYKKDTILSLGDQSDGLYINLSNIEIY